MLLILEFEVLETFLTVYILIMLSYRRVISSFGGIEEVFQMSWYLHGLALRSA